MVESSGRVPDAALPLGRRYAKAAVRRLHVAARIDAWAARELAHLADNKLSPAPGGIGAAAASKAGKHGISPHPFEKLIDDCCNSIVAAQASVKWLPWFPCIGWHVVTPLSNPDDVCAGRRA